MHSLGCDLTLPCALAIMLAEAISPAMPRSLIEIGAILLFVDTLMVWLWEGCGDGHMGGRGHGGVTDRSCRGFGAARINPRANHATAAETGLASAVVVH